MSGYDKNKILSIIDDVLDGSKPVIAWDDLVSIKHNDERVRYWANKLRNIELSYSDPSGGQLLSSEGLKALKSVRSDLEARDVL